MRNIKWIFTKTTTIQSSIATTLCQNEFTYTRRYVWNLRQTRLNCKKGSNQIYESQIENDTTNEEKKKKSFSIHEWPKNRWKKMNGQNHALTIVPCREELSDIEWIDVSTMLRACWMKRIKPILLLSFGIHIESQTHFNSDLVGVSVIYKRLTAYTHNAHRLNETLQWRRTFKSEWYFISFDSTIFLLFLLCMYRVQFYVHCGNVWGPSEWR